MKKCVMERIAQMKECLEQKTDFLADERIRKMESLYISNADNVQKNLEAALKKLVPDRGEGELVISYLRSSYLSDSYEFYIAYYEGEAFVMEEPDCVYYDMQSVFYPVMQSEKASASDGIDADLQEIDEILHKKFIRVSPGEEEEIHKWYVEQIYKQFVRIIRAALERISVEKNTEVYYGGYMDAVEPVGRI